MGIFREDTEANIVRLAEKIVKLRIVNDENGKMSKSILDTGGSIMVVSQFTLLADTSGGNRPSFIQAASPEKAKQLYEVFVETLKKRGVKKVVTGAFGTYMQVRLANDGPVTIIL